MTYKVSAIAVSTAIKQSLFVFDIGLRIYAAPLYLDDKPVRHTDYRHAAFRYCALIHADMVRAVALRHADRAARDVYRVVPVLRVDDDVVFVLNLREVNALVLLPVD